jgi:hypothetical protein
MNCAITTAHAMKPFLAKIEAAGYTPIMMQDGSIDIYNQDGALILNVATAEAAEAFLKPAAPVLSAAAKVQKASFFNNLAGLYRIGNASDSAENKQAWTKGVMAGEACCGSIDKMMRAMVAGGVITEEECQEFYDTL